MMKHFSKIELHKEDMKFSVGHFTIFSETERENLHGHNYFLHVTLTFEKNEIGLSFDYRFYKDMLRNICKKIDEVVILPGLNKYLSITETASHYEINFNSEKMSFLKRDILILPITNVTVEELSDWFMRQLIQDKQHLITNNINTIHVKIYSGPGQSASSTWELQNA